MDRAASPSASFSRRLNRFAQSVAVLAVVVLPAGASGQRTPRVTDRAVIGAANRAAALSRAHASWGAAMRRVRPPATGCAVATYPSLVWHPAPCGVAPNVPVIPRKGAGHPFVVGNGPNDVVPHTNPATTSADGSFSNVSAGVTENGLVGNPGTSQTDAYSLQLNTNTFAPSSGCTTGSGPNCRGWEQFIYENNDSSRQTFIQYWLIAFNTTCPAGWASYAYPGPTDISCYRNSASASLPADQPVSNLANLSLTGEATATRDRGRARSSPAAMRWVSCAIAEPDMEPPNVSIMCD